MTKYNNHIAQPFALDTLNDDSQHSGLVEDSRNALHESDASDDENNQEED